MEEKNISNGKEFVTLMMKLRPDEFCALCKVLDVRLLTDEVDPETKKAVPRESDQIIDDCITHFVTLNHRDRRFLVQSMRRAVKHNKKRDQKHGTSTEHTTKE